MRSLLNVLNGFNFNEIKNKLHLTIQSLNILTCTFHPVNQMLLYHFQHICCGRLFAYKITVFFLFTNYSITTSNSIYCITFNKKINEKQYRTLSRRFRFTKTLSTRLALRNE